MIGAFVFGPLAAGFYPTANRATGVAWANAVGRSGSVLGSRVGGTILSSSLGLPTAFAIVGLPVILAGLFMVVKGRSAPQPAHRTAPTASSFANPLPAASSVD